VAIQTKLEADKARAETDSKLSAISAREKQLAAREASITQREKALEVEPTLVASVVNEHSSSAKTVGLQGVSRSGDAVLLALDGAVEFKVERVDNPPRLVVDLVDTARKVKKTSYGVDAPNVRRVRLGEHDGSVRAVFDLASSNVEHDVVASAQGVKVTVRKVHARVPIDEESAVVKTAPVSNKSDVDGKVAQLRKVDFSQNGDIARITLDLSGDAKVRVDDRSKKAWVLEIADAHVEGDIEKSLDTSAYGGAVRLISTYQASRDPQVVNIVVQLSANATQRLVRDNGKVIWEISGTASAVPAVAEAAVTRTPQTAGYASAAATVARAIPAATAGSGRSRRVSLNFKDADIVNVIRLIADVTGENIITSEDVKGKVTVRLRNVPWETALDTILKSKGYDKVRQNNILRISSATQIQQEREAEVARQRANELIEEKVIKIVTVNYATASEIVGQLKGLLSSRGTVQTDDRTNTIIVEDVRSNIERLVELVRRLDKQTPQVLIEARIVEASTNFSQALGVQWGGQAAATANTGNPTGLSFPGDVLVTGANPAGTSTAGVTTPANYAVNLPAAATTGGAIGLVFGSAGGSQLLQLRLAALESKGTGRIISSPRVATLDNRTARIAQGVDIPITVTSAAGANTRFVPANLELEVTPHVTNDGSILMRIRATRNEPNFARTGAFGDPTIERREAQTEVLVQDGDTTVIGGIYTRNTTRNYSQVPVLSQIPVIGWLFKSRADTDNKSELLIFVSPHIVNRQESVVASGDAMSGGG
ncbi:MAG: type IV pilus secretin PilQ, partial [Clostridia bacterium]|nr:type IV pilus secretin PilQ [Deltaproteobacteria bacterium]